MQQTWCSIRISIHSTARVETGSGGNGYRFTKISIHSTARVETDGLVQGQKAGTDFNPLHREGGDASRALLTGHHLRISIHSTARVETTRLMIQVRCQSPFQSTPPRGWRLNVAYAIYSSLGFQSTPPRGWRPYSGRRVLLKWQFQSTPPRGWRRMVPSGTDIQFIISIHSTARVETDIPQTNIYILEISIHSTARVETFRSSVSAEFRLFQSTPPRGWRRFDRYCHSRTERNFNPLHREGGDQFHPGRFHVPVLFQSTPPRGWRLL